MTKTKGNDAARFWAQTTKTGSPGRRSVNVDISSPGERTNRAEKKRQAHGKNASGTAENIELENLTPASYGIDLLLSRKNPPPLLG